MSLDLKFDWHLTSTKIIIILVIGLIGGGQGWNLGKTNPNRLRDGL